MISFRATTLRESLRMEGTGIFAGGRATVVVHPGSSGLRVRSHDEWVEMTPDRVTSTDRCTEVGGVRMVEHLLSALGGAGVTDADIEVDGPEVPILDGSSAPWFEVIQDIGIIEQDITRTFEVEREVTVAEGDARVTVGAGDGVFRAVYERDPFPGRLEFSHRWEPAAYGREVAPARTFASEEEVKRLQSEGLLLGGTPENALVFGQTGYLTARRFDDEPARHKVLDCMGDMMLCGIPLRFLNASAERSGHRLHVEAARALRSATRRLE